MKTNKLGIKLAVITALTIAATAAQGQFFTPGNLVVFQVGNGSSTLNSAGTADFLTQFTTAGTLVNSFAIPATGASSLVTSGSAGSEGSLTRSANGQYLVFAGYNVAAGTAGVGSATASTVPRAIGTVDSAGNYSLAATTSTFYSANNMRGGTGDGNGHFWGAGAASGTVFLGAGSPAQLSTVNSIVVQDVKGNLFYSTAKGTTGIYEIPGEPTAGPTTPTLVLANANPADFAFNSDQTVAYVANTSGGIQPYDLTGSAWVARSYTLDSGMGFTGLAVDFSGPNAAVYATTSDGKNLLEITDIGAGSTTNVLATFDGTKKAVRGLEFAPVSVPEPATLALAGGALAVFAAIRRLKNRRA